jgi:hypothetical protein
MLGAPAGATTRRSASSSTPRQSRHFRQTDGRNSKSATNTAVSGPLARKQMCSQDRTSYLSMWSRALPFPGLREKVETFSSKKVSDRSYLTAMRAGMQQGERLRTAVDTAWTVYRATHGEVHAADRRRSLLERHLDARPEARDGEVEELATLGLAYLAQLPIHEC